MWRFVLDRGKEGAGIAVNTVNTELIRFGTPGTGWFVRLGLVSFNRIESVGRTRLHHPGRIHLER